MTADKPLLGWRVLVTRPAEQANSLMTALAAAGAIPISYPTIAIKPPPSWAPFDEAVTRISSYPWIVFTSPSAVRSTFARAPQLVQRLGSDSATSVAAVGTQTARALGELAIPVAMVPDDQRQEGLVSTFAKLRLPLSGSRVLFPQALGGRQLFREALQQAGVQVDVVPVSETSSLPLDAPPPPFDAATFASPSALRALVAALGVAALAGKTIAVIGPTTQDAARAAGLTVHVVAPTPSPAALVAAMARFRASP